MNWVIFTANRRVKHPGEKFFYKVTRLLAWKTSISAKGEGTADEIVWGGGAKLRTETTTIARFRFSLTRLFHEFWRGHDASTDAQSLGMLKNSRLMYNKNEWRKLFSQLTVWCINPYQYHENWLIPTTKVMICKQLWAVTPSCYQNPTTKCGALNNRNINWNRKHKMATFGYKQSFRIIFHINELKLLAMRHC